MKFFKVLNYFTSTHNVGIIGLVLTVFGILVGLYFVVYYEKKPKLKFEILSTAPVLDVKEEVGKLDILYDGKSIKRTENTLTIITIKIINDGNASILLNYFDSKDPVGILITEGAIVEKPKLLDASNEYLNDKIELTSSINKVIFSEFILDPEDFFTMKILVLHNKHLSTRIKSFGKIATIKEITVTSAETGVEKKTYWDKPFGTFLTWSGVIIVATLVTLIIKFFVKAFVDTISGTVNFLTKSYFKEKYKNSPLPIDDLLLESFRKNTESAIFLLQKSVKEKDFAELKKKYPDVYKGLEKIGAIKVRGKVLEVPESVANRIEEFDNFVDAALKGIQREMEID